jgi:hypothetical protein
LEFALLLVGVHAVSGSVAGLDSFSISVSILLMVTIGAINEEEVYARQWLRNRAREFGLTRIT